MTLDDRPDLCVGAYGEELLLLDAPTAGAGRRWDLGALGQERPAGRWLLAGGLTPENVREAVRSVSPWGVEGERGVKDHERIREFVRAATGRSVGVEH